MMKVLARIVDSVLLLECLLMLQQCSLINRRYFALYRRFSVHSSSVPCNPVNGPLVDESSVISVMRHIVGNSNVLTESFDVSKFNLDWTGQYNGKSKLVVLPNTTDQIQSILEFCSKNRIYVVPQGGNTGLVGGGVPIKNELILSMARMNKILSFDKLSGTLVCEAGCTLQQIESYLHPLGFMVPLDLASKGSCMIGGNVSTNAGGLRYLRYGSMHQNTLGLIAVTGDGRVIGGDSSHPMSCVRKTSCGPNLKNILIGSEGLYAVITHVALSTPPLPALQTAALVQLTDSPTALVDIFNQARFQKLSHILSSFEYIDVNSSSAVDLQFPALKYPFPTRKPCVLIEISSSNPNDSSTFSDFLEEILSQETIATDIIMPKTSTEFINLWKLRENISVSLAQLMRFNGIVTKFDLSVSDIDKMLQIANDVKVFLRSLSALPFVSIADCHTTGVDKCNLLDLASFGHLGDGNIHLNVVIGNSHLSHNPDICSILSEFVYRKVIEIGGSISAEHGIGQQKKKYLRIARDDASIEIMRGIKRLFDPAGILNPGKVFDDNM